MADKDIENPKSDVENPKSDVENPKSDVGNPKSDIENPKSDVGNPKSDVGKSAQVRTLDYAPAIKELKHITQINIIHLKFRDMKKFNYLVMGLLAVGAAFTSCSNEDVVQQTDNTLTSDTKAYIAVNLVANQSTRAGGDLTFEDGTGSENAVTESAVDKVRFYFFNADGSAYNVDGTKNYVEKSISDDFKFKAEDETGNNVESESDPVIVIEKHAGVPASMVAILNPSAAGFTDNDAAASLSDLTKKNADYRLSNTTVNGKFIMTNSVYADGGEAIQSTALKAENIASYIVSGDANAENAAAKQQALSNPVDIYVERVLAKVVLTDNDGNQITSDTKFDTKTTSDGSKYVVDGDNVIYAKIIGFDVFQDAEKSYLIKNINTSWDDNTLGFTWNDSPRYRSYWASNPENVGFTKSLSYPNSFPSVNAVYPQENTDATYHTNVVVGAQLVDKEGNPVEIAVYKGEKMTVDGLKNKIALSVANEIYYKKSDNTYAQIAADMITFKSDKTSTTLKDYEVVATLNTTIGEGDNATKINETDFYYKDAKSATGFTQYATGGVNSILNKYVARIYTEGKTYYYIDINHLATESGKTGLYGVVRNHLYKIQITGIEGLGTPVYTPESETITPIRPMEERAYVAAKIHVLAWRIVNNSNVILK